MEDLALLDPNIWVAAIIAMLSHPLAWVVIGLVALYIVLNSKAIAAWFGRKKSDDD